MNEPINRPRAPYTQVDLVRICGDQTFDDLTKQITGAYDNPEAIQYLDHLEPKQPATMLRHNLYHQAGAVAVQVSLWQSRSALFRRISPLPQDLVHRNLSQVLDITTGQLADLVIEAHLQGRRASVGSREREAIYQQQIAISNVCEELGRFAPITDDPTTAWGDYVAGLAHFHYKANGLGPGGLL